MDFLTDFLEWVWARHHNEWSWYVRPLFLFAVCYFSWRKSWPGLLITFALFPTSLFWFPAPDHPSPQALEYLAWERTFFIDGSPWRLAALLVAVALYLWALVAAFWRRSWLLGLLVINVGILLKIAASVGFGGDAGMASILPSVVTAAIVNGGILFWRLRSSR